MEPRDSSIDAGEEWGIQNRHTTHARVGLTNPGDPCALLLGFSVPRQHSLPQS
jgi:hypothetical protein